MMRRVLLIEDQEDLAWVTSQWMSRDQWHVVTVENGRAAVEHLERDANYHLIVTDYLMLEMDGEQFLSLWRQHPHWSNIPAVMYSSHRKAQIIAQSLGVPMISKGDVDQEAFRAAIQKIIPPPLTTVQRLALSRRQAT